MARGHLELTYRHARTGGEVHGPAILDDPSRSLEGRIDVSASFLLRREWHGPRRQAVR